jgi:protein SCO1/2
MGGVVRGKPILWIGIVLVALVVVVIGVWWSQQPSVNGLLHDPRTPAYDFALQSDSGQTVRLSDFRGRAVMLYFGYTFCPDVCPTTLAEIRLALQELGPLAQDVQVIMVTVDPARDTPEKLQAYLEHFGSDFLGLTGTDEALTQTVAAYDVRYTQHEGTAATGYLIDHTADVMVIDRQGNQAVTIPFGMHGPEIASDLRYVLQNR